MLESGRIEAAAPSGIAMVGINGSGKSSLLMHLADTLVSSHGAASLVVDGRRASIAYVPQMPAMPEWLRVEAVARVYGIEFATLRDSMPELYLGELTGARAGALSIGQKQVLSIALALGRHADVTLLDEPFSALDFRRRIGALALLRRSIERGGWFLLSSQVASDLIASCVRFVVIRDGRYVFNGVRGELAGNGDDASVERGLLRLLV